MQETKEEIKNWEGEQRNRPLVKKVIDSFSNFFRIYGDLILYTGSPLSIGIISAIM